MKSISSSSSEYKSDCCNKHCEAHAQGYTEDGLWCQHSDVEIALLCGQIHSESVCTLRKKHLVDAGHIKLSVALQTVIVHHELHVLAVCLVNIVILWGIEVVVHKLDVGTLLSFTLELQAGGLPLFELQPWLHAIWKMELLDVKLVDRVWVCVGGRVDLFGVIAGEVVRTWESWHCSIVARAIAAVLVSCNGNTCREALVVCGLVADDLSRSSA